MKTEPGFRGQEIVVVDDTELFALCVKSFLAYKGFEEIELFVSAATALEEIRKRGCPAFIITDLEMPGMTGDLLLEEAGKIFPEVKGVIITACEAVPPGIVARFDVLNKCDTEFFKKLLDLVRERVECSARGACKDEIDFVGEV